MDMQLYNIDLDIKLRPIWHQDPPIITINIGSEQIYYGNLDFPRVFKINKQLPTGPEHISVWFHNKTPSDTVPEKNLDKAVIIESISIYGITSNEFVLQGVYRPEYPSDWYQQQLDQGSVPDPILKSQTYLGWNGEWRLEITSPIFTWIHRVQNLGWIYE